MAQEETKTYRGNCHCGAFVYEADLPEVKSALECNCSICHMKGILWLFPANASDYRVVKGEESQLTTYTFGKGAIQHKFCPDCGTSVMGTMASPPPGYSGISLNARAIQGLDVWALERHPMDGAAMGDKYEFRPYTCPLPTAEIEDSKLYTGHCHCGALQVALKSKPLDASFPEMTGECNCSICSRNAYIWVWPLKEQVVLHGKPEDIGVYYFANKLIGKTFCKRCGTQMTNKPAFKADEEVAAFNEQEQRVYALSNPRHPVTLRVLEGVNVDDLKDKMRKLTTGATWPPLYTNP